MRKIPNTVNTKEGARDIRGEEGREGGKEGAENLGVTRPRQLKTPITP